MKYWYDDNTLDTAIAYYKRMDDKILVHYFNGNVVPIQYKEEIEKELIQEMICQAEERDKNISIETLKSVKKKNNLDLAYEIGLGYSGVICSNFTEINYNVRLACAIISIASGLFALNKTAKLNEVSRQIEELEKYKLYLSMRKEIEGNYNQETFNGIRFFDGNFNINTLDNYSLNEVKRIKKNLLK